MTGFVAKATAPLPIETSVLPGLAEGVRLIEEAQILLGNSWTCSVTRYVYSLEEALSVWRVWEPSRDLERHFRERYTFFTVRYLRHYTSEPPNYEQRWLHFFQALAETVAKRRSVGAPIAGVWDKVGFK